MSIFLFILGAIIGSFLNVVGLRWRTGLGIGGRSFCPSCGKELRWWELVPVLSFIILRGKCSSCHAKISWQYPLVEIFTGLVFATLYCLNLTLTSYFLLLATFCIYIIILIYDFRHKIIPDGLVYSAIALGVLFALLTSNLEPLTSKLLSGFSLFAFFAAIWALSRGRAMGFGDAKLALSIGLLLGLSQGLSAIVLAFWLGAVVSLTLLLLQKSQAALFKGQKGLTMKSEIPFAPYMILGAWLSLILHLDLFHVLAL